MKFELTVAPFMLAFMAALIRMPLNVVQVCYGELGIEHAHPWRSKATAALSNIRSLMNRLCEGFSMGIHRWAIPLACLAVLIALVVFAPGAHAATWLAVTPVVSIKQLRQDKADNDAAQARLKSEARTILAVAAKDRTPEQTGRLTAIDTEFDGLTAAATIITSDLARAERYRDEDVRTATGRASVEHNNAEDRPWGPTLHSDATPAMKKEAYRAALGEFGIAVMHAYEGKGADPRLMATATGMNTMNQSDGGFAIPPELAPGIEQGMFAGGELLSRVDTRTISGDSISYNVIDETSRAAGSRAGGVQGYWVDQGTAPTATQVKLARIEMKLRKVATLGYMTDELVSDASALGGELESSFVDELIFQTEDAIVEGTGAGQPLGYQNAPCLVSVAKETGQAAASIMVANLSKMWARLPARSKKNAVWLINVDTEPQLDLLTIPAGTGAVEPRFVVYAPDGTLMIKGRPVVRVEYCATLGTVGDIALTDLTRYRLIRKGGPETASSIHVRFTQGEQTFKATYRVDGQPVPRSAITPFKGTSTLSPFVVLATRS